MNRHLSNCTHFMNILVVYAHPLQGCFCRKVLDTTVQTLQKQGHSVQVADLYKEKFQPVMVEADFAQFIHKPMPEEIIAEQKRVEWSDGLVFIFPVWWWSMPAMLKGWIDRVMAYGWAWLDPMDPSSGPLPEKPILVMTTAGASAEAFTKRQYDLAFDVQLRLGTWDYCGFRDVTTRIFHDLHDQSPASVGEGYLDEIESLCQTAFNQQ